MIASLRKLWRGEVGLAQTFWEYTILYGTLLNLMTTVASFAAITTNLPAWIAVLVHFAPLPYNAFIAVAVWRSADRYAGDVMWANAARVAVLVWAVAATLL